MSQEHYVIIGNGPSANQAALTIRQKAPDARVTMVSRETANYYRPHLLPDLIAGTLTEEDLYVNPLGFYKENGIKLRLGQEVAEINFPSRELILAHKEVVRYDGLIIAVGGKPRIPEPLLPFRDLMLTLKTLDDARVWIDRLAQAESVVIVGGDLTSLALVKALLSMGKKVSFILSGESFWPLRAEPRVFEQVETRLAGKGVEVVRGHKVRRVTRLSESAIEVETDQSCTRGAIAGAFFGLVPAVRFLARSGLHVQRGVLVDETLKTRFDRVYAAGDCAQVYCPEICDYWVSIGHENARNLGKIAAANCVGEVLKMEPERIFCVEGVAVNTSWWMEF
ncbi:MAG: FAD-dependent oxidoreductase [Thermodesulfobacteriota bacterium]